MTNHCPYCNGKKIAAIAPVSFSGSVLVEHRCGSCGHLFCIMDRRDTKPLHTEGAQYGERMQPRERTQSTEQLLRELRLKNQSKRSIN